MTFGTLLLRTLVVGTCYVGNSGPEARYSEQAISVADSYGVRSSVFMLQVPTVGIGSWDPQLEAY